MKTNKVSVALPGDLYDQITGLAHGYDVSAATLIRAAIYAYLCRNPEYSEAQWREVWQAAQQNKVVATKSRLRKVK